MFDKNFKKVFGVFFLLIYLFFILNISFNSAAVCSVVTESSCDLDYQEIMLYLSDSSNAHAALPLSGSSYEYVLCCSDLGEGVVSDSCSPENKTFLRLSDTLNAHVQTPSASPSYPQSVCYSGFEFISHSTTVPAGQNFFVIASLNEEGNNSHIGAPDSYPRKIYANLSSYSPGECELRNLRWKVDGGEIDDDTSWVPDGKRVELYASASLECEGLSFEFRIYENSTDELVDTFTSLESSYHAYLIVNETWNAQLIEMEDNSTPKYYFEIEEIVSGRLFISDRSQLKSLLKVYPREDIEVCMHYLKSLICSYDPLKVADYTVNQQQNLPSFCSGEGIDCFCEWNESLIDVGTRCVGSWRGTYGGHNIGKCTLTPSNIINNCDESGLMTIQTDAEWEWADDNPNESYSLDCPSSDYVAWPTGGPTTCYYDPEGLHERCRDGSLNILCPAFIPLEFFNAYNFIIAVLIISGVYFVLSLKKQKKEKIK
ncbi:hypothetical protein K0A97_03450 [Patescibacteria group bacterium]|nr:hypothetical protein [Patescibacteria group bacterium]